MSATCLLPKMSLSSENPKGLALLMHHPLRSCVHFASQSLYISYSKEKKKNQSKWLQRRKVSFSESGGEKLWSQLNTTVQAETDKEILGIIAIIH